MKGLLTLKKSAIIATVCMVVLCLPGYSEPTPEQIAERTKLLCEAVENNNVERAKLCIKLGADVNAKVYEVYNNGVSYITTNRNKIRYCQIYTHTLLTYAVMYEPSKDILELLIKSGADVNAKDDNGRTALLWAVQHGKKDTAELLIKSGADVNAKDKHGWTALMSAACNDNKDTAELLIQAGADMNVKNNDGHTALIHAVRNESKDTAKLLIKAGADKNATLIWAVKEIYNFDAVELLIKAGANVNATDSKGISALDNAILYGKKDIADLLRAAGATE